VEGDRVERHADVGLARELRAHAAHRFACRPLALVRFALEYHDARTAGVSEVPRDGRADDSPADDGDIGSHAGKSYREKGFEKQGPRLAALARDDNSWFTGGYSGDN